MKIYDLNWRLEHHPLAEGEIDATDTSGSGKHIDTIPLILMATHYYINKTIAE